MTKQTTQAEPGRSIRVDEEVYAALLAIKHQLEEARIRTGWSLRKRGATSMNEAVRELMRREVDVK